MDEMDKQKIFEMLKARKAHRAEVVFSGGNDEGGVESVTLFGPGRKMTELKDLSKYNWETRQYECPDDDSVLYRLLEKPVDDEYGSFAGEYYVSGKIVFRTKTKEIVMEGEEEVSRSESFERTL